MIAYELQLRYVIREKIQEKDIYWKKTLSENQIINKKNSLGCCLGFPVRKVG